MPEWYKSFRLLHVKSKALKSEWPLWRFTQSLGFQKYRALSQTTQIFLPSLGWTSAHAFLSWPDTERSNKLCFYLEVRSNFFSVVSVHWSRYYWLCVDLLSAGQIGCPQWEKRKRTPSEPALPLEGPCKKRHLKLLASGTCPVRFSKTKPFLHTNGWLPLSPPIIKNCKILLLRIGRWLTLIITALDLEQLKGFHCSPLTAALVPLVSSHYLTHCFFNSGGWSECMNTNSTNAAWYFLTLPIISLLSRIPFKWFF